LGGRGIKGESPSFVHKTRRRRRREKEDVCDVRKRDEGKRERENGIRK